ncbi:MAG: dihydrofolate reductase [Clostridioides sp.]|jgi:dihydrofolate reductase|nr:dihydrofolate reductase [Clostridioides sp.]
MKAIVNVSSNWGIGCNNQLLTFLPEDMKFFKEKTTGNVVVMGRLTFESLPGRRPLKDRVNIVITKTKDYDANGAIVCNSIEEVAREIEKYTDRDIYIIGGASIYKKFLPYCDEVYVTKNSSDIEADAFFENLDEDEKFKVVDESEIKEDKGIEYKFVLYKNKKVENIQY